MRSTSDRQSNGGGERFQSRTRVEGEQSSRGSGHFTVDSGSENVVNVARKRQLIDSQSVTISIERVFRAMICEPAVWRQVMVSSVSGSQIKQ